jgi:hypothetical protein
VSKTDRVGKEREMSRYIGAGILVLTFAAAVQAQSFSSGSLGTDGALTLTAPGTVEFDPAALGIDPDGDLVFHFTTITIGPGVTVRLSAQRLQGPVVWLATGNVQIDGIVDLNGENGQGDAQIAAEGQRRAVAGAGGFAGGLGGMNASQVNQQPGLGPGGGLLVGPFGAAAGNASHATQSHHAGPPYGNDFLLPLVGGSGGGGGYFSTINPLAFGTGGGAGGGAILVASSTAITVAGTIRARGGDRGLASFASVQWGGAGSGGSIHLLAPVVTVDGTITAAAGLASNGLDSGSPGRIRIEAVARQLAGATISPTPALATAFGQPLILTARPRLRVTSIVDQAGTHLVADPPSASFAIPDVTIDDSGPVTVNIEAQNIPVGTVVQLHVVSQTGPGQVVDASPLVGTSAASTATATVTLPSGFSRGFVRAVFTPTPQ